MIPSSVTAGGARQDNRWRQSLPDRGLLRDDPDRDGRPLIRVGFGACAKSGCGCRHYEGSAGTCTNAGCRHSIGDHW